MIGAFLCVVALVSTYLLARRSFVQGILAVLTAGYFYGILRANFFETFSHFIFDAAVVGLYAARFKDITQMFVSTDGQRLKHWITLLILIPFVMFFIPLQDPLVQLVGLRGNAFLIPFVLIGARLRREDWYRIGLWLACLNLAAFAFAGAEYMLGIQRFFPHNAVTRIIYASNDVGSGDAYRIPSIFANAHSFGATMVLGIPLLAGSWVQRQRDLWHKNLLVVGLVTAILGVFLSATRSNFVVLVLLIAVATFSSRMRPVYRVGWILVLVLVGYVVSTQQRMQRFTTLERTQMVEERIHSSVNATLLDAMIDYPFGVGLGGGGTSMPFFLQDRVKMPLAVESEWGRIVLETGLIGLFAWCSFVIWVFTRPQPNRNDPAFLGCRLAWFVSLAFFGLGFIGRGLFTSIPGTSILLMLVGWIATHHTGEANMSLPIWQPGMPDPRILLASRRELVQR